MVSRKSFREVSSLDLSNDNCLLDKLQRWVGLKNSRLWIYEWDGNWEQ